MRVGTLPTVVAIADIVEPTPPGNARAGSGVPVPIGDAGVGDGDGVGVVVATEPAQPASRINRVTSGMITRVDCPLIFGHGESILLKNKEKIACLHFLYRQGKK